MCEHKSDTKSAELRGAGNVFYSKRRFFEALIKYNESLCYAERGSENAGLAYANRSAVYFEMKLFRQCLYNIELAKSNQYPVENFEILNKREAKCKEPRNDKEIKSNPWDFFKLSYPPKKEISFIANCLEMRNNEKFGRHIVTNRPLKVGDVVSIETPYCNVLLSESEFVEVPPSNIYQRCSNCFKAALLDLLPCSSCCQGRSSSRFSSVN